MARLLNGLRVVLIGLMIALGLFAIGFVVFANTIDTARTGPARMADGIVVLTGGTARIEAGVDLLSRSRAKRLLISGVNRSTTREELRRLFPQGGALFRCCIDLGRRALNTTGNAIEAQNWAQAKNFTSLIVVTSSYHMPRTMVELRRAMPEIELIPYAVEPNKMRLKAWWTDSNSARLLFVEYVKYLPALARSRAERLAGVRGDVATFGAAAERP